MPRVAKPSAAAAVAIAVGVAVVAGAAITLAFDASRGRSLAALGIFGGTQLALAVVTLRWLHRRGRLRERLRFAYGDVSKGFAMAAVLYAAAWVTHQLLTGIGSSRAPWIIRAYLHVGDPASTVAWYVSFSVMVIAAAEELVWRGGVLDLLTEPLGKRRALGVSTLLYGLSYGPTVLLLSDPFSGPNPILPVAALVGGAAWGVAALLFRRVMPVVISHGLLVWALVAFPLWRP